MKSFIFLVLFLSCIEIAQGATPLLLTCETEGESWNSTVEIDENGRAFLQLKGDKETFRCPLAMTEFDSSPRAHVPNLSFVFKRGACNPGLNRDREKRILKEISLMVFLENPASPRGLIQWLRYKQTTACSLTAFNKDELQRNARRFELGTWGKPQK